MRLTPARASSLGLDAARPSFADVVAARERIAKLAVRTPLRPSLALSERLNCPVFLKLETVQPTGAFKLRGAATKVLALDDAERARGLVTASTGNHGRAVAYAARAVGARCVVCLSKLVPANKVAAVRALGAEALVVGEDQDEAFLTAHALARDGMILVDPFDDPLVVAGQGTIGAEIVEDLPAARTVLVPVSGGGLAAGVALAAKALKPDVRVIGVSSDRCPAMLRSLEAGRPVEVEEAASLADSLGGGIGLDNRVTFAMVRDLVDEIRLVSDKAVAAAMRFAFRRERLVLEGAAAAPLAVLLAAAPGAIECPIVALATGDNVDPDLFIRVVSAAGNEHA
jgi:threonine dehydratase